MKKRGRLEGRESNEQERKKAQNQAVKLKSRVLITVVAQIPKMFVIPIVQTCSAKEWLGFRRPFKI